MTRLDHPTQVAARFAAMLKSDPVATAQLKEHIRVPELLALLHIDESDIPQNEPNTFEEMMAQAGFVSSEALEYVLDHCDHQVILSAVYKRRGW